MSSIIDFNNYKNSHAPETLCSLREVEALAMLNSAFGAYLHAFSANDLILNIHARVGER